MTHFCHSTGELAVIGEKTIEQIELVPMRVQVIRHIRKTYHCPVRRQSKLD